MATPGKAPFSELGRTAGGRSRFEVPTLLRIVLQSGNALSDLIFSPGRPPQLEIHGELITPQEVSDLVLSADDTRRIAVELIGDNKQAVTALREQGFCDVSYALPGMARFRANIFIQRGSCAIVMRIIPTAIPTPENLRLPDGVEEIAGFSEGIVLVVGPRGSGKSSTLAVLLDQINQQRRCHIVTLEDPIEFLHNHKLATIHQRELHSDTPSFAQGMRAALRQAPNVIFVGEIRERETMELVLQAAETGHLVLSSLNTPDIAKTVDRMISFFPAHEQSAIRGRLARTLRLVVLQRRILKESGNKPIIAELIRPSAGDFETRN